jgi:hypothetical protein
MNLAVCDCVYIISLVCNCLHFELLSGHKRTLHFQNGTKNKCGLLRTPYLRQSVDRFSEFCFRLPMWYAHRCRLMPLVLEITEILSLLHMANEESAATLQHEFRTDVHTELPRHVDFCGLLSNQSRRRSAVAPGTEGGPGPWFCTCTLSVRVSCTVRKFLFVWLRVKLCEECTLHGYSSPNAEQTILLWGNYFKN